MPPQVNPATGRLIRIEDIDRGVKRWFDRVLDANVTVPDGTRRKVTVKLASGERWVAAADREGIRDRDGRLILPVIQVRRTGVDPTNVGTALASRTARFQVARLVDPKTSDLANLDQLRPISARRLQGGAVYDIYTIPFPSPGNFTYSVRVQAQYQTQMNEIMESLNSRLQFHGVPSFVISLDDSVRDAPAPDGVGSTERQPLDEVGFDQRPALTSPYCVGFIDGQLGDDGNLDEFTDQERIIQLKFNFRVPTVMVLDPQGRRPAVQHTRTAFAITLDDEQVHTVDDPAQADRIFGPK